MRKIIQILLLAGMVACLVEAARADGFQQTTFSIAGNGASINNIGSGTTFHKIVFTKSGTVSACSVVVDSSADNISWNNGDVIASQDCSANGSATSATAIVNYTRVRIVSMTGTGTVTVAYNLYANVPFNGGASISSQTTVTPSASFALAFSSSPQVFVSDFFIALNQNITITSVTGSFVAGQEIVLTFHQNPAGGFTVAFPANFLNVPTVQAGSGLDTAMSFQYCGAAGSGNACPAGDWQNTDIGPTGAVGTTINNTNNTIPKRSNATTFVDSAISDDGTTVNISEGVKLTGSNASVVGYTQGPDPTGLAACTTANTRCEFVGTAVTAFKVHKSDAGAQGVENGTFTGSTVTQGFSGDTNHSTTVTIGSGTSIGSTSLCSTTFCPVGTYRVNTYIDITTACGTSGTYVVNLIYTDDQGSKTIPININGTGAVASTGVLTTTSTANFGEDTQIVRSTGAASINYSTTAVACGTAGPMVGKLYLSVEAVQ